jgi:peptidoglycan-associated lipoprotein
MDARASRLMIGSLVVAVMTLAGCAAKPDMSRAGAPSPTGAPTGSVGGVERGSADAVVPALERDGSHSSTTARPSLRDYVAVAEVADIHFDFDKYDIRRDAAKVLERSAEWLKAHPSYQILIEGHADERGTNEYNLALGDRRAKSSMNFLVSHGVPATRITILSYGEERGVCAEKTEGCWAKNRRAHFAVKGR